MSSPYQNNDLESSIDSPVLILDQEQKDVLNLKTKIALGAFFGVSVVALGAYLRASSPINATDNASNSMMAMNGLSNKVVSSRYSHRTNSNENAHELIYLDRHNLDCGGDPIAKFQMRGDRGYDYECMALPLPSIKINYHNNGYHADNNLIYYDRQSIFCPHGSFMTQFYGRAHHGNFGYEARCTKYDSSHVECSTHYTGYNEATDKTIVYLDRHDVNCPQDTALQGFKGQSSGGQIRYEYNCCSIYQKAPTMAPVASPTHSPTDRPTDKPIAEPTFAPTVNESPLVCPVTIDSSNKYFRNELPSGCALIALHDIETDPESKAIIACGEMKLSKGDLEDYGVKKDIDQKTGKMKKGRSISYLQVGSNIKIDYFATEDHSGSHDSFEHGDEPIRGHLVDGVDINDHIKSLKIEVKSVDGLEIPKKCSDMEIFN